MRDAPDVADKDVKLRIYAAVALILVAIAAISFLIQPNTSTLSGCRSLLVANSKYECISALALKSYNASMCGSLSGQYANTCYDKVALASKNAKVWRRTKGLIRTRKTNIDGQARLS